MIEPLPSHRGTEFPWSFMRRSVRPFHLSAAVAMLVLSINNLVTNDTPLSRTLLGDTVGIVAVVASMLLFISWWVRSDRAAEWGLLLACGVWTYRAILYMEEGEAGRLPAWVNGFGLSVAWMIGTGGAWLLERYDHHERKAREASE